MKYNITKPWLTLDPWQEDVLEEIKQNKKNLCLRTGRQVGKSTITSIGAGEFAMNNKNKTIMIIASVERQALLLFEKVLAYIHARNKNMIKTGNKEGPTKHRLILKNGSKILCLPTGETGYGIRGFTIDLLIADEAAYINEEVWTAVTPMMVVTGGKMILLSTPRGRVGYFYDCFQDKKFKSYHVTSLECPRMQTEEGKAFLDHERERKTKAQFTQEYLGEFVDKLMQFFPDYLIKRCQTAIRKKKEEGKNYYLGVDVGGLGGDKSTFEVIKKINNELYEQVENETMDFVLTTDTTRRIMSLERSYDFKKIYVDDGGIGFGVFSELLEEEKTRRKVIAINNASRPLTRDEKRKKKILKEDLYNNLLNLMERGKITLLDDPEILTSLRSVQYEYEEGGKFKIFGRDTHIAEGLVRAAWCSKDKSLNIYIY